MNALAQRESTLLNVSPDTAKSVFATVVQHRLKKRDLLGCILPESFDHLFLFLPTEASFSSEKMLNQSKLCLCYYLLRAKPDAYFLVLICQMLPISIVVVEGLDGVCSCPKVIL